MKTTCLRRLVLAAVTLWTMCASQAQPLSLPPGKGAGPRQDPIIKLKLTAPDRASLDLINAAGYDIDGIKGNTAIIYADQEELRALQSLGWAIESFPPPPAEPGPRAKGLGVYNGYVEITAMLDNYAAGHPQLCRMVSLGKSVLNRDLWAMKITTNPDLAQDKPRFRYVSTLHGNEAVGTEMCLYLIDLLLTEYTNHNPRIVNLVDNVEIWIVPLANPDGRERVPPRRYNNNGYDLNRSFPEGGGNNFGNALYGPPMNTNSLQPEVRHLMAWSVAHNFCLGANLHTGALVVNYPYDNDGLGSVFSPSPDEILFQAISRSYSSNNPPMWNSPGFPDGIVNGAAWYSISGGLQDWSYRYEGSMDVTIEVSDYQWPDPPAAQLPTYWSENRESMLAYLEWCLRGVRGVIRDAQTGQPIRGTVRAEGYHHLVFSDAAVGDYHRLLLPGTYTLWFYAPGYQPKRVPNVVVGTGNATRLDINLEPANPRFFTKINFAPAIAAVPLGHRVDSGAAFGPRADGFAYGWETSLPSANVVERRAGRSQDLRYDTLIQMQAAGNHNWEIAVPNGPYSVLVAAGDPSYANGFYRILAENVLLIDGAPPAADRWLEGLGTVTVTDGRLTLSSAAGAVSNRLNFVEISATEPTTIEQWRALHFGTTANAGSAADDADADQDTLLNLIEYALGQNPLSADPNFSATASVLHTNNADWLQISFPRNTRASDLTLSVETSDTLGSQDWSALVTYTPAGGWSVPALIQETAVAPGQVKVTLTDPQPLSRTSDRFVRVVVRYTQR